MSTNRQEHWLKQELKRLKSPSAAFETTSLHPLCKPLWLFPAFFYYSFLLFVHSVLSALLQLTGNMKQKLLFILCYAKQSNSMSWPWNTRHPTAVQMLQQINHLAQTSPFLIYFGYWSKQLEHYIDFGQRQHKKIKTSMAKSLHWNILVSSLYNNITIFNKLLH